ncbi:MAG TPA: mandelate racemase/muconate lactonizing enzyme family protein [Phycisphaerae bacterium]|nr:mandelate racemase/muconate lactonizing enzyme family protein [Phycisphaerae bacterium]
MNRRSLLQIAVGGGALAATSGALPGSVRPKITAEQLDKAAAASILKLDGLNEPVKIASVELLRGRGEFFVRTRSTDGAEGLAVTNGRAAYLYPIFQQLVAPYFVGKDARRLESLIDGVYTHRSNYKLSGLALWCCVAWAELSVLDLLGKVARKPVGELLGGVLRKTIPIYVASGRRDTTPAQEVAILARGIEQTGAKAVKLKVGGRMSNNADSLLGRTEGLIPLARKTLGDAIALHADSNGSYDARKGIEVGKLLAEHHYTFFEEPCPFDHLEETRRVADAVAVPIAGGEQETSLRRFRWMIHHAAVQVVQPDLHYNGGLLRATRVARMAAAAGLTVTPHMSGEGVGIVDVLHFASCTPNIGPFQEYKGAIERKGQWYDPPLKLTDGAINVPTAPGLGLPAEADVFRNAK